MTKKYRLAEALAGAEIVGWPGADGDIQLRHGEHSFRLPSELVTQVAPIPREPGDGTFALVEYDTEDGYRTEVWQRQDEEWTQHGPVGYKRLGKDWAELHDRGTVTVLVRDPAAGDVELPAAIPTQYAHRTVRVDVGDASDGVRLYNAEEGTLGRVARLTPHAARAVARALWRAATELEADRC